MTRHLGRAVRRDHDQEITRYRTEAEALEEHCRAVAANLRTGRTQWFLRAHDPPDIAVDYLPNDLDAEREAEDER